jgi:hypothetical protein
MKLQHLIHTLLGIICFAVLPKAQAVVPPPDGGYPNFNTAEGTKALFSLTAGSANTAVGWFSLGSLTTGSFNTATGAGTLLANTADENTAIGAAALLSNSTGGSNTASGVRALLNNIDGGGNVAMGVSALLNNTSGFQNTAIGFQALDSNTIGHQNTAIGLNAGHAVTTASNVICIGDSVVGENVNNSCYIGHIFAQSSPGGTAVFVNTAGKLGTNTSSRRFKEAIKPMDKASEVILALKPVTFHYRKDIDPQGFPQFGLVAEDVAKDCRPQNAPMPMLPWPVAFQSAAAPMAVFNMQVVLLVSPSAPRAVFSKLPSRN